MLELEVNVINSTEKLCVQKAPFYMACGVASTVTDG
jgi:hypothetical protein